MLAQLLGRGRSRFHFVSETLIVPTETFKVETPQKATAISHFFALPCVFLNLQSFTRRKDSAW
jgi:hypothetical protein